MRPRLLPKTTKWLRMVCEVRTEFELNYVTGTLDGRHFIHDNQEVSVTLYIMGSNMAEICGEER